MHALKTNLFYNTCQLTFPFRHRSGVMLRDGSGPRS